MGFMDKAKKLAEQAQQKLDEAQQNFNKGGSTAGQPGANQPTGAPTAPSSPAADAPAPDPEAPKPQAGEGETNATPDPFKPPQQ